MDYVCLQMVWEWKSRALKVIALRRWEWVALVGRSSNIEFRGHQREARRRESRVQERCWIQKADMSKGCPKDVATTVVKDVNVEREDVRTSNGAPSSDTSQGIFPSKIWNNSSVAGFRDSEPLRKSEIAHRRSEISETLEISIFCFLARSNSASIDKQVANPDGSLCGSGFGSTAAISLRDSLSAANDALSFCMRDSWCDFNEPRAVDVAVTRGKSTR